MPYFFIMYLKCFTNEESSNRDSGFADALLQRKVPFANCFALRKCDNGRQTRVFANHLCAEQ